MLCFSRASEKFPSESEVPMTLGRGGVDVYLLPLFAFPAQLFQATFQLAMSWLKSYPYLAQELG